MTASGETEFEQKCLYSMAMNMSLRYCIMLKRLVKAQKLLSFFYSSKGDQGVKLIDRSNAFQRLFAVLSVTHYSSMP